MNKSGYAVALFSAMLMLSAGHAAAANYCQTDHLTCGTTMPVDGYCECRARGTTEDGTVVAARERHTAVNSTAAGCGTAPNAPGCR